MADDVILAKAAIIERCIVRAREERAASADFAADYTRQDAAILNVERACEAAIDIANRLIRLGALGAPAATRESFAILAQNGLISDDLSTRLQRMAGFRNIAVHQYRALDFDILVRVIDERLDDLLEFSAAALRRTA
ncbi:MAG: DUF86 domain-containing protein [Hyphomonadaceae bacterium]|nr:DUF86 domain-containing protein [Hyphomonadaceae bacterium]